MSDVLREVTEAEYKQQILMLLDRIHRICKDNDIRYSVAFGTLIGTVRHKGFIPWDDDIDICMPREDYKRFAEAFTSNDGRYYVLDSDNSRLYYHSFARACDGAMTLKVKGILDVPKLGAFVDIFFLDKWPEDEGQRETFRREIIKASGRLQYSLPWSSFRTVSLKRRIKTCMKFYKRIYNHLIVGVDRRKKERDALLLKYMDQDTGWRNVPFEKPYQTFWFMREEDIGRLITMKFENIEVNVPANYDELMKAMYGDYMKLPPEDKRTSHHHFTAYWS